MKMAGLLLLSCFVLTTAHYFLVSAHMIPEERLSANHVVVSNAMSQSLDVGPPSVLIVELPKTTKSKKTKKQKKNKFRARRPPPPANCVPLWGNCKSALSSACCDFCAFCQCRLLRTVCFCRMGNPRC